VGQTRVESSGKTGKKTKKKMNKSSSREKVEGLRAKSPVESQKGVVFGKSKQKLKGHSRHASDVKNKDIMV